MSEKIGHLFFRKLLETKNMLLIRMVKIVMINDNVYVNNFYYFQTILKHGNKWKPKLQYELLY